MKVLKIENLSKSFDANLIFENINLEIAESEFVCLAGPSGCGKSTLLNIIMGFDKASSGLVNHKNEEKPNKNKVMVFQDFNQLFPWLTVNENIAFALGNDISDSIVKEKVQKYLELVGLNTYGEYYPNQLSGGQKQRVAIARSLIGEPEILCMDEPFASLDIHTRAALQNLVIRINKELKTTIVFVTHDLDEAVLLSDKIVVISGKPAVVAGVINNDLKSPRDKYTTEFRNLVKQIDLLIKN